jgi:hypothetical protein
MQLHGYVQSWRIQSTTDNHMLDPRRKKPISGERKKLFESKQLQTQRCSLDNVTD